MFLIKEEGLKQFQEMLQAAGRHAPFALANAMNDLAFQIRTKEMETIAQVFDRPKPQTVRNIRVRKATKQNLSATIAFWQVYEGDDYMVPHIQGGKRGMKKSEKAFGRYYVAGAGARKDAYGNMLGSQVQQVMSQLGMLEEVGYLGNQTAHSRSRSKGVKKTTEYFLVAQKTGGLVPGVYQRVQSGAGFGAATSRALPAGSYQRGKKVGRFSSVIRGRGVVPVMIFVNKPPTYAKRYPFYDVGQQVVDTQGAPALQKAIEYALRTAR